jgi:hypothetical protein
MSAARSYERASALSRAEWVAFVLAIGVAHAFYVRSLAYPSDYDAQNYLDIAVDLARSGLFAKFFYSELRPYGYPLFLRMLKEVADALRLPWGLVIFEVQLALYACAALFVRSQLARASLPAARIFLVATLLNVVALVYVADTLAECLSLVLLLIAAGCWTHLYAGGSRIWLGVAAGSLALGAAVVVRPANVFALPVWVVALAALAWLRGWSLRHGIGVALLTVLASALPMLPQLANNVRHYDKWTPLVAASLGRNQQIWGIAYLKYATALPPIPLPSVFYMNPYAEGRPVDEARPLAWYVQYPGAGAVTLGLHVFGMLDQDLLFTYARDLDPWYRRPLGILTHGAIALAGLAFVLLATRARQDRGYRVPFVVLSTFCVFYAGLHATTAVEMRFGLPLLVVAGPLAAWFVRETWTQRSTANRLAIVAFVAVWITASLVLSDWMRSQAAPIRDWEARTAMGSGGRNVQSSASDGVRRKPSQNQLPARQRALQNEVHDEHCQDDTGAGRTQPPTSPS